MENSVLVSIIVPVYNTELYLEECVKSILKQQYENIEIILVDDGSTDGSYGVCKRLALKDIRIRIYHNERRGTAFARNFGIKKSRGNYLVFVDSDDYVHTYFIHHLVELIHNYKCDLAMCNYEVVGEEAQIEQTDIRYCDKDIYVKQYTGPEIIGHRFGKRSVYYTSPCNKIYKRELFIDTLFEEGRYHEDEFIYRPLYEQCKKVACSDATLYFYRKRKGSTMDQALCDCCINDFLDCFQTEISYNDKNGNINYKMMYEREFFYGIVLDYDFLNKASKLKRKYQYRKYAIDLLKNTVSMKNKVKLKYVLCVVSISFFRKIVMPIFYNKGRMQGE